MAPVSGGGSGGGNGGSGGGNGGSSDPISSFTSTLTNKPSFTYLQPDGTRRELALNATTGLYESYDASWLEFNLTTKVLRTTDGTQVTFGEASTLSGDFQYLPTQIKDRNGNFLTIVYKTLSNNDRVLDYVLETAGRRLDFYYESNRLREIRQDGFRFRRSSTGNPLHIVGTREQWLQSHRPERSQSNVSLPVFGKRAWQWKRN